MRRRTLRTALLSLGIGSMCAGAVPIALANVSAGTAPSASSAPVKHVIEIMLENHSFDNLFGSFPGANGIPKNVSMLNPNAYFTSAPNVSPIDAPANEGDVQGGINNSRVAEQMAMDYTPGKGYLMDHYTVFPQDGMSAITEFGPQFDPTAQYLANNFELEDNNFQAAVAPTQPNVMYSLNGTAHGWMYNNLNPNDTQPWNSIFDELARYHRTGRVYYALPPSILNGTIWDKIVPSASDLTTANQFFTDLKNGDLPDFSFVRPGVGYSEEPQEDIAEGDLWLGQLVNAVAHSQYWNSTAIFFTYDEGGGFWDHVVPPSKSAYGYGTRTPTVIISPYARKGVYHQQTTNISILSFMQHLWNLPALTSLNACQNDLFSAFDFQQKPLAAPTVPNIPTDTIAFNGATPLNDLPAPNPGQSLKITLNANNGGLTLDSSVNGAVSLQVTPPAGVAVPSGFPSSVMMVNGTTSFSVAFPTAGYYRVHATGPGGSEGWTTIDVGVTPNTP